MRLLLIFCAVAVGPAEQSPAERLIEAGHWKRARTIVEARLREAPADALSNFLLSQIRGAFGDRSTPLALAEKAVALDGRTAKYHRQLAEVLGVTAQHAGAFQQLLLAHRFRREIDAQQTLGGPVVRNQPSASEARWKLGMALQAQGRDAEALAEFRESVRLDPESRAALELKRMRNSLPAIAPNSTGAM